MVEISRPSPDALSCGFERRKRRHLERDVGLGPALRQIAAERGAALVQVFFGLGAGFELDERQLLEIGVRDGDLEAVAELAQILETHLLLLMGDHLAFAGLAHAVALDGLGQDDGRLALVLDRRLVRGVDLHRIMPAARQRPDLLVGPVCDHRRRLGVAAEELLADVRAVLGLEVLVLAVDALFHELPQPAGRVLGQQLVPLRTPDAP